MIKRFYVHIGLILAFTAVTTALAFCLGFSVVAHPIAISEPAASFSVLLVPLDSRPPCTDYVRDLARMAGMKVIMPPPEILDDYRKPGNKAAVREWARENISRADAAIISVDMLVHGGLLASRQGAASGDDMTTTLALLQQLHEINPAAKLYAFNIIPRLLIADNPATDKYKRPMLEWSTLQDIAAQFGNPVELDRLRVLEEQIPLAVRERYQSMYFSNSAINRELVAQTKNGILSGLVIGQDDSAPFGLANMERRSIEKEVAEDPQLRRKIFVTRGTDEVALTLLGQVNAPLAGQRQKMFVHYTEAATADTVMPYMPGPLSLTVAEKMELAAVDPAGSPEAADFILVVHAGSSQSQARKLAVEADRIKSWLHEGRSVAVIDLARDFSADQTLLPYLRQNNTPVYDLLAYAGWNTASNSTGTAITQAVLVLRGRTATELNGLFARETERVGFIASRLLDDWYYQKVFRPRLNTDLAKAGIDPYALQQARTPVTETIRRQMNGAFLELVRREWRNALVKVPSAPFASLAVAGWDLRTGLPWDRTFEIYMEVHPLPAIISRQ